MSGHSPRLARAAFTAGVVAAVVLATALLGLALGLRPVVITTGSMGPAVPSGSLVIAHEVAADEVSVGDVIVMERSESVRVTHRVVEIATSPDGAAAVTKGDANAEADPFPYPLDGQVMVVERVVPVIGTVVAAVGTPLVALMLVLASLALLVVSSRAPEHVPAASSPAPRPRRPGRTVAGAGLLLFIGCGAAAVTSLALFTDSEVIGDSAFTTGTLDISASPVTAAITMAGMAPGDQVTAPLDVSNDGSLELRYSMRSTTTEDTLAGFLELTVKAGVSACDDTGWTADGTILYSGPLGSTASTPVLGSAAPGGDPGDRVLGSGSGEELCLNVTLPLAVSNAAQGLSTSATFTLDAEQTANNP